MCDARASEIVQSMKENILWTYKCQFTHILLRNNCIRFNRNVLLNKFDLIVYTMAQMTKILHTITISSFEETSTITAYSQTFRQILKGTSINVVLYNSKLWSKGLIFILLLKMCARINCNVLLNNHYQIL